MPQISTIQKHYKTIKVIVFKAYYSILLFLHTIQNKVQNLYFCVIFVPYLSLVPNK